MTEQESGWTRIATGVVEPAVRDHCEVLDCYEVHFALLCARVGVADVLRPFASDWFVDLAPDSDDHGPELVLSSRPIDEALLVETGCAVRRLTAPVDDVIERLATILTDAPGALIAAEARRIPWSPYFRRASFAHAFVVDSVRQDTVMITDAYASMSPWGPAEPVRVSLTAQALHEVLGPDTVQMVTVHPSPDLVPSAQPQQTALGLTPRIGIYERFAAAYRSLLDEPTAADRLNTEVWRLHRKRSGQRAWLERELADVVHNDWLNGLDQLVTSWRAVVETAFLARRRCLKGKSMPTALYDRITEVGAAEDALVARLGDILTDVQEVGS
jgi:hypothetical protein